MFWYSWHMGVTNQTLEHLRLLRSGGVLQRYQDQTLIRQADLQIPLREDEFKRLYTPGLIERTSFDTLEEYQLTSDGHRVLAEQDEAEDLGTLLADVTNAHLITTAKVQDENDNDIPYFLLTILGELTPRQLLELTQKLEGVFAVSSQIHGLQLTPAGGLLAPLALGLPAPHIAADWVDLPPGEYQDVMGGAIFITPDGLDIVGVLEDGRQAFSQLSVEELREAIANAD